MWVENTKQQQLSSCQKVLCLSSHKPKSQQWQLVITQITFPKLLGTVKQPHNLSSMVVFQTLPDILNVSSGLKQRQELSILLFCVFTAATECRKWLHGMSYKVIWSQECDLCSSRWYEVCISSDSHVWAVLIFGLNTFTSKQCDWTSLALGILFTIYCCLFAYWERVYESWMISLILTQK